MAALQRQQSVDSACGLLAEFKIKDGQIERLTADSSPAPFVVERLASTHMKKPPLSDSLRAFVESQAKKGAKGLNGTDPLYADATHQRISYLTRSAETRNGLVLQRALFEGLQQNAELSVLNPRNFPITREVIRELDIHDIDFCRQGIHLPISKHVASSAELDIVAIRHRENTATIYELRRGSGGLGYRAMRAMLRKLVGAQMLLRAYVHRELGIWVDRTYAHLIIYFAGSKDTDPGFPPDMLLTRDDLDEHFGFQITAIVDAANSLHGKKVTAQLNRLLRPAGVTSRSKRPSEAAGLARDSRKSRKRNERPDLG